MLKDNSINTSRAVTDGIIHVSSILPLVCSKTYRDEEGKIKNIVYPQIFDSIFNSEFNELSAKLHIDMLVFVPINIFLFFFSIFFNSTRIAFFMLYFCAFVSYKFVIFVKMFFYLKFRYKSIARYHAAEHMANNACRALGRIPTMEEVKHFSRFSKYCGSMSDINYLVLTLSSSLLILFFHEQSLLIATLLLALLYFIGIKYRLFRFLQVIYTNKPTDADLEVAIESLKNYQEMENDIKNGTLKDFELTLKLGDLN